MSDFWNQRYNMDKDNGDKLLELIEELVDAIGSLENAIRSIDRHE